jgi:hypothetical protein
MGLQRQPTFCRDATTRELVTDRDCFCEKYHASRGKAIAAGRTIDAPSFGALQHKLYAKIQKL